MAYPHQSENSISTKRRFVYAFTGLILLTLSFTSIAALASMGVLGVWWGAGLGWRFLSGFAALATKMSLAVMRVTGLGILSGASAWFSFSLFNQAMAPKDAWSKSWAGTQPEVTSKTSFSFKNVLADSLGLGLEDFNNTQVLSILKWALNPVIS